MKKIGLLVTLLLLLTILFSACANQSAADASAESGTEAESIAETDLFADKAVIEYAQGFTVEYFSNYKLVTITKPWDMSEETFQYVLVQRGTEAPTEYGEAPIIQIPVEKMVSLSTTYLPFLDVYGKLDTLVAIDDTTYVYNPTVLEMAKEASLVAVGYGPAIDIETLLSLEPDVIMTSGYGNPEYDTHPVLQKAGLPVVINGDYMETTPLARAEWGKFIALFYNEEKAATEFFNQTVEKYNEIKSLAADIETKPTVFLNTAFEGTWYMPGGQSYMATFIADAGGDYLWKDDPSTSTLYLTFEEVYDVAGETGEIWINPGGYTFTTADILMGDERHGEFAAFKSGQLYNNVKVISEGGGIDFYESGIAYPDVILADLFSIFHPAEMEQFNPDFESTYYIHVEN